MTARYRSLPVAACSIRQASPSWPFSRLPSMRCTAAAASSGVSQRTIPPALPRPPTGTCALTIQGPSPGRVPIVASETRTAAGTVMPCSASSVLPSASISSMSVGAQAQDALVEIQISDDLAAHQVAQCFRGAAADGAVARTAIQARYRGVVGEAEAAVKLYRFGCDAQPHLVAEHLCGGRHEWIGEGVGSRA